MTDERVAGSQNPSHNRFRLEVSDSVLRRLLSYVATSAGWAPCENPSEDMLVVTDVAPSQPTSRPMVVVVDPTPFAASTAVAAVAHLEAGAILCADSADSLVDALDTVEDDSVAVQSRVLRLAREMPELTERQVTVMRSVVAGRSNAEVARLLHLSVASIKRELAELYTLCGVSGRAGLAVRGLELGLAQVTGSG